MCICMLFSYNRAQSVIFRHEKNNYSIYYMSKYMYINGLVFFWGGGGYALLKIPLPFLCVYRVACIVIFTF